MADRSQSPNPWMQGSTLGVGMGLVVALAVMINYLGMRHYKRFDWTSSQLYSLSDKSLAVARDLEREIDMVIFLSPGSELYDPVNELLSRYAAANPERIKKREVDPARNLLEAQRLVEQYSIERENVVIVASDDDRRVIDELDLAEYDYSGAQYGQPPKLQAFKGEQLITSALLGLSEAKGPKALFTTGHGEAPTDLGGQRSLSRARDILERDNVEIEAWSSLGQTEVPTGTDLIVVAGPTTNFLPPELELFSRYLEGGGRMLMMLDPVFAEGAPELVDLGLGDWLASYGVEIRDDIVIDPSSELPFFGAETLYTDSFGVHPIVDSLSQDRLRVLMPLARSVQAGDAPEGHEVSELVRTSPNGWGETDLAALPDVGQDDADLAGPVPLGVAVSFQVAAADGPAPDTDSATDEAEATMAGGDTETDEPAAEAEQGTPEARLVVFGDFDFASDAQVPNGANRGLLLNALNWLVEREELIEIAAREPEQTSLTLSQGEISFVYLLVLVILPGIAVAAGIWVYMVRRR
ncbi:MAG: GldG family protein [Acidobacteriota bacterium]